MKGPVLALLLVLLVPGVTGSTESVSRNFHIIAWIYDRFDVGGSAFFVEPIKGVCDPCILTAQHVWDGQAGADFYLGRGIETYDFTHDTVPLTFVRESEIADLALFTADKRDVRHFLGEPYIWKLAERPPARGEEVNCWGSIWSWNPLDVRPRYLTYDSAYTKGVVCQTDSDFKEVGAAIGVNWHTMFWHTATAKSGFSGCPIGNTKGELVGVEVGVLTSVFFVGVRLEDVRDFLAGKGIKPPTYGGAKKIDWEKRKEYLPIVKP